MAVYFRCSECGGEHPSAFQMDKASFESASFRNNSEPCPATQRSVTLDKRDLFWKDER